MRAARQQFIIIRKIRDKPLMESKEIPEKERKQAPKTVRKSQSKGSISKGSMST